jgi:membrane-associated protease RseP (regulator of RpoE activity)
MEWYYLLALVVGAYALVALILAWKKPWGDHISFYGPILAVKSFNVRFFDWFIRYRVPLRVYGTVGMVMVGIISLLMALLLIITLRQTILHPPPPTGLQNILLIPGLNEYVPLTLSVIFGLFLTIAVHEFGHGVLCRVENIRVKSMGVLFAIIPLGFFVEPDEEELEKSEPSPKMRMFGAGIMNNVVIGLICFVALIGLVGLIIAPSEPIIYGVFQDGPAYEAGIQPDSVIEAVNGTPVMTVDEVSGILSHTRPGDMLSLTIRHSGEVRTYDLTLAAVPENVASQSDIGFMGIYYYPGEAVIDRIRSTLESPVGILYYLVLPITIPDNTAYERILVVNTIDTSYYQVPFPLFWGVVHLVFWTGWINLVVGTFNAIPMVPLDGGYIMREGIGSFLKKRGWERYTENVVYTISWVMLFLLVALIVVPYLFQLATGG